MPKTNNGFLLLHRSMVDWEWYSDINTTRLFLHLLLTVNFADSNFQGVKVPKGSRICSISKLGKECQLTNKEIRTAIDHLERTGSVARTKYPKFTVITLINWDQYQDQGQAKRQQKGKQSGKQGASKGQQNNNINNATIYKKEKGFAELPGGIPPAEESPEERARRIADLMR